MSLVTIDRVSLRTQRGGAQSRARQHRALGRLERCDPLLPGGPSEVLVLRQLADAVPGALGRNAGQGGPGDWDRGLDAALAAARACAVRPGRGVPLDAADAVLFADEVELLACLVERLAAGRGRAWWAQVLMARLPPGAGVAEVMARQLHLLPALIAALLARGSAPVVLARLTEAQAERLAAALAGAPSSGPVNAPGRAPGEVAGAAPRAQAGPPETPSLPAVSGRLAEVLRGLHAAAAQLLALAWMRRRRPALTGAPLVLAAARVRSLAALPVGADRPIDDGAGPTLAARDPAPLAGLEDRAGGNAAPSKSAAPDPKAAAEAWQASSSVAGGAAPPSHDEAELSVSLAEGAGADRAEVAAPDLGIQTASALGGVFFLVNLFTGGIPARAPELAAALAAGGRAGDSAWTALERLARALLPAEGPGLPDPAQTGDDPLWRLLAQLDGRPADQPATAGPADHAAAGTARRWLMQAAFGPDRAAGEAARFATLLCRPAMIFAAPLHLDVVFAPQIASLPVRRAGLDLDPGWQPRFGRIIAFHYRERGGS